VRKRAKSAFLKQQFKTDKNKEINMKQEEQKKLREKKKVLEKAIKAVSKKCGYKSVMGYSYKIIDGFLYEATILPTLVGENVFNPKLCINIDTKPLILDDIFWKVFDMYEVAKKQPESFHVKGSFTARGVNIDKFYQDFFEEENQEIVVEKILEKITVLIENNRKKIFDIDTFEIFINEQLNQELNKILISIIKTDYSKAENMIDYCIKHHINGGFMSGENLKTIIEYAKDYINNIRN